MLQCRCRTQVSWKFDIPPKPSARRAGEVQCLGEMPWVPGDCDQARQYLSDVKNSRESITLHFNSNSLRGRQAAFGGDRVSWRGWQSRSRGNHKIEFSIARGARSSSNRATVLCHARALWRWLAEDRK